MSGTPFRERLAPCFGRRCSLRIDAAVAPTLADSHGETWELFVFDWDATAEELRAEIHERSNQEAFDAFALIAPAGDDDLATLVSAQDPSGGARAGSGGFLLCDGETIYVGDGDVWPLTRDLDGFLAALALVES